MKVSVIEVGTRKGTQSVIYTETLSVEEYKLRISIKSDAYDFQSHARIEVFSKPELKWNELAHLHPAEMLTPAKLVYQPRDTGLSFHHFRDDRNELLRQATRILDLE